MSATTLLDRIDTLFDEIDPDEIAPSQLRLIACRVFTLAGELCAEFDLETDDDVDQFIDEWDDRDDGDDGDDGDPNDDDGDGGGR